MTETRRRRAPVVLRACIGVFLLLISTAAADTKEPTPAGTTQPPPTLPSTASHQAIPVSPKNESTLIFPKTETADSTENFNFETKTETEEKATIDEASDLQGTRSRDDKLTDSTDGASKLEKALSSTSGKAPNPGTRSQDTFKPAETEAPSTTTPKSATKVPEETPFVPRVRAINDTAVPEVKKHAEPLVDSSEQTKSTDKRVNPESEPGESSKSPEIEKSGAIEAEKRTAPPVLQERKKKADAQTVGKHSEVQDLRDAEGTTRDAGISLINDTFVNYSHRYKSSERDLGESGDRSRTLDNSLAPVTQEPATVDPKEEVEVVSSVSHPVVQRIVDLYSNSTLNETSILPRETSEGPSSSQGSSREDLREASPRNPTESVPETDAESEIPREATQVPPSPVVSSVSSPVPRGRTIGFSGANEFSVSQGKPTIAPRLDTSFSRRNVTEKPYPYAKTSGKDLPTEEPSALENTIGRSQSEEKFPVTEASDVLENSIQQFRPRERQGDQSTTSRGEASSSVSMTTSPRTGEASTIRAIPGNSSEGLPGGGSGEGNAVPGWSHDGINAHGSFDVTGNGITEVSPKERTTEPLRTGVQTNAQGSLLIRSTLNATEVSTEYPLTRANSTEESTSGRKNFPEDVTAGFLGTEISETVTQTERTGDANNEIPSERNVTPGPGEIATATVEYEFVGLTESTTSIVMNNTEDPRDSSTVVPTMHDLPVGIDVTTPGGPTTTEDPTTVGSTDFGSSDESSSGVSVTTRYEDSTMSTVVGGGEGTTPLSVVDGETDVGKDVESGTTSGQTVEPWSTTDGEMPTIITTEVTDFKESHILRNFTESPEESTAIVNVTDATRMATTVPFVSSSLSPKVAVSSSTVVLDASSTSTERTSTQELPTPRQEDITSLVRIDMDGGWYDVCPKMDRLRSSLAEILRTGMNTTVSDKQIIFHQDPCRETPSSTPTSSDMPFISILVYVVDGTGKFDAVMTKILPSLYEDFQDRVTFPVAIHRILLVQETIPDSGNAIAVIVVSSVAFICLILLAGLLFIMRKRQTRFNYGERCRPVSLDAYSLDSVSAYNSVRRKGVARSSKRSYGNPTFEDSSAIPSHPLNFAGLSSFCNDVNAINEEFSAIPQVSAKIDELPVGAEVKNRYANVIPLPETRVPLQKINNDPLSEYINASYVRGPKNATRYYIACQAPMESTVTDFWRMIWEQQCKVIIMLTDLVENGMEKCTEYVPPSELTDCHRLYGDYQVTLKKRETKEKYAISTLHLKNLENNTFREVYHIWYLWPVNGAQSDGAGLIAVLLEARALQRGGPGPIVVHCSPGTGRTGTLIALDLGIRQYEITRTVDVPRVVYTIRRDRAGAVQTKEQYAFIHKALNLYATKLAGGVLEST